MSQRTLILSVATTAPQTPEALCVAAWQADPRAFGLKGYNFPDYNRFVACLCKTKLIAHGHLLRDPDGRLRLPTAADRAAQAREQVERAELASLAEPLRTARASEAYKLFHGGRKGEIHSGHARAFFNHADDMDAAVAAFRVLLCGRETEATKMLGAVIDWFDGNGISDRLLGTTNGRKTMRRVSSTPATAEMKRVLGARLKGVA